MRDVYYLVSQPRRPLEQSLACVLVHNQSPGLRRDRAHSGAFGGRGPVKPRRHCCLWWNTGHSGVCLGLQGGWTERSGRARLDWRAGIVMRRGVPLPRGSALLSWLWGENHSPRHSGNDTGTDWASTPGHRQPFSFQSGPRHKSWQRWANLLPPTTRGGFNTLHPQKKKTH